MALADTAKLIASLTLKDGFTKPLATMDRGLSKFDTHLKNTQSRSFKAGQQIGTGIKSGAVIAAAGIGFLISQVGFGLDSLGKLEEANAATEAAIKSTGGIARVTADDVRKLAEQYENLNATIDDKVIQSAENMLLTFTNIRNEAFGPALEAALNLNTAMGGGEAGLQGNIIKVGKALNDPTKGLTALSRVGVKFTDQQKKQIIALQKSGDLLGAQKIILQELGTEFGGRFAAQGKTTTGTIAGIGDAVEDLQKSVAKGLFPVIQKLLPKVRDALSSPAFIKGVEDLGDAIAGLFTDENIATGSKLIGDVFNAAKDAAPIIASAAGTMGEVIKTSVGIFRSLPPEIQALAVAGLAVNKLTGGLVTNLAGGLISAVISSFRGLMNVNAAVVNVNGAVKGVPGIPGGLPAGAAGAAGTLGLGTTLIGVAAAGVIGGLIAEAITVPLSTLIDPEGQKAANEGRSLGNRDPRRFNENGQVTRNFIPALKGISTTDNKNALRAEQSAARHAKSVADAVKTSGQRFTQAIKDKDSTVVVNNKLATQVFFNGRLFNAADKRFTTTIVGSRGSVAEFG